ncbi:hypothetical protein HUJ05_006967 [Dendroctonus ponderosae]|nr:hypothetical protein HUJ05_006967 [Dendroctonus ponderosae]KAH1006218.1 hypothetical protein HUJ05_006967 [Dendroctonus ponderosae]
MLQHVSGCRASVVVLMPLGNTGAVQGNIRGGFSPTGRFGRKIGDFCCLLGDQPNSSTSPPLRLTFRATPGAGSPPRSPASSQSWDAVLRGDTLYVAAPPHLGEGSRQAFVALLEAAEDQLKCKHVIVVFSADRPDHNNLVRTFKFIGFSVLSSTSELLPSQLGPGNVYMLYNIEE